MRISVLAAAVALTAGVAAPAHAAATPFVELNPSTVPAGESVSVRASCDDSLEPATVTGEAFGTVTVKPEFGFLTANVRVPADTEPANYWITLKCPNGGSARTTLHVVEKVEPNRGPATGGGGTAGDPTAYILIVTGLTGIAAGAALGVLALRRRRIG